MEIYLDNSATTKPCARAIQEANEMMTNSYGNPSSQHKLGIDALNSLNLARERVANALYCNSDEIYFAPSGTQANNAAIFAAAALTRGRRNNIVTSQIEHPSVQQPIRYLESKGANVIRLRTDSSGKLSEDELFSSINKNTSLISIMLVNNEIGSINPIQLISSAIRRSGSNALIHCDAVQAFGKIRLNPAQLGVDFLSISSHKIHGPKGAAALYVRKGLNLQPFIHGGGQEKGLFSGTENLPAIVGFGAAVASLPDLSKTYEEINELRDYFVSQTSNMQHVVINSPYDALPYIINLSVIGIPSEVLVNHLSSCGIYISAGSACKRGHKSEVIRAMGLSQKRADSAVRISLSRYTTKEELDILLSKISEAIVKFRR